MSFPSLTISEPLLNAGMTETVLAELHETGVYTTEDDGLHACVNPSPKSHEAPCLPTQMDLVFPPVTAFNQAGVQLRESLFHSRSLCLILPFFLSFLTRSACPRVASSAGPEVRTVA